MGRNESMETKKVLAAAVLAAVTLGVAAPAFAADPKWSGETRVRWTSVDADAAHDDADYRLRLTFTDKINDTVGVKARFVMENDFAQTYDEGTDSYAASEGLDNARIDIMSMNFKLGENTTAVVGLDDVWVGNGLLVDATFEAAQLATKLGGVDASLFVGRDNGTDAQGVSLQKAFDKATVGANYIMGDSDVKVWSVNGSYDFGAMKLSGEFADFDGENAYMAGVAVKNFKVTAYDVEDVVIDWKWSTLDVADSKGIILSADWAVAKNMTLTTEYQVNDTIDRARVQLVSKF
jgi:Gram-negative porin